MVVKCVLNLGVALAVFLVSAQVRAENTQVCVDVVLVDGDFPKPMLSDGNGGAGQEAQKQKADAPVKPLADGQQQQALGSSDEAGDLPGQKLEQETTDRAVEGDEREEESSELLRKLDQKRKLPAQPVQPVPASPWRPAPGPAAGQLIRETGHHLPLGHRPIVFLKRLLEHYISHEDGYTAAQEVCQQTLRVELYPLTEGWTAFARYSGTGREERVDRLLPSELSQFSERAVLALLKDVPISTTINRENVLLSDSDRSRQTIKGSNHFAMALGTQLRGGKLDTIAEGGGTEETTSLFSPMVLALGYRGKFESWGLETTASLAINPLRTDENENDLGGHIDYGGSVALQLHFFHYFSPRGLTSFYLGAGSTFELMWFHAIKDEDHRNDGSRSSLVGGGLDIDAVIGWEFMRASSIQFFLQAELNMPAYVMRSSNSHGHIDTWFPGMSVKLGVAF